MSRTDVGLSVPLAPNTRVQRTRSSASPPRSPLTRDPFGGFYFTMAVGIATGSIIFATGCETIDGKQYWTFAWPSAVSSSSCQESGGEADWTVAVDVRDHKGLAPLPGVTVRLRRPDGEIVAEELTDTHGVATLRMPPGTWRVDASLSGFDPVLYPIELGANQKCTVKLFIHLDADPARTVS